MNLLILDGYDEERGALLSEKLGPGWTVTEGRHSDPPEVLAIVRSEINEPDRR